MANIPPPILVIIILLVFALLAIGAYFVWNKFSTIILTCKVNADCPSSKICQGSFCKTLPGNKCTTNLECSSYAPTCHPTGKYCTNYTDKDRGTQGNPLTAAGLCDPPSLGNINAKLCQGLIGTSCIKNGDCYNGLCFSGTCSYVRNCGGDEVLNAHQCPPGQECNDKFHVCGAPGIDPGAPGSPCTVDSECTNGKCIPVSGGGVCSSGLLTFAQLLVVTTTGAETCYPVLKSEGNQFCGYPSVDLMQCNSDLDCQFPYSTCSGNKCALSGSDPINGLGQSYDNIASIVGSAWIPGTFLKVELANTGAAAQNYTGGKLILPYIDFCPGCVDLNPLGGFVFSFSAYSSMTVTTFRRLTSTLTTIVYDDPNPILAATFLLKVSSGKFQVFTRLFQHGISVVPNLFCYNAAEGSTENQEYDLTTEMQLWNHSLANDQNVGISYWIQNPIINSDRLVPVPNPVMLGTFSIYSHTLITTTATTPSPGPSSPRGYMIAVGQIFPDSTTDTLNLIFPVIQAYCGRIIFPHLDNTTPLSTDNFVILSWDAYTFNHLSPDNSGTIFPQNNLFYFCCNYLIFGYNKLTFQHELLYLNAVFRYTIANVLFDHQCRITLVNFIPGSNTNSGCLVNKIEIPPEWRQSTTCFRMFRNTQLVQPFISFVAIVRNGIDTNGVPITSLQMTSIDVTKIGALPVFSSRNQGIPYCSLYDVNKILGLTKIRFVSSITADADYGCFVVWGETADFEQVYVIFKTTALCNVQQYFASSLETAIYWVIRNGTPTTYYLYSIGGGSIPYFIRTSDAIDFRGQPLFT